MTVAHGKFKACFGYIFPPAIGFFYQFAQPTILLAWHVNQVLTIYCYDVFSHFILQRIFRNLRQIGQTKAAGEFQAARKDRK